MEIINGKMEINFKANGSTINDKGKELKFGPMETPIQANGWRINAKVREPLPGKMVIITQEAGKIIKNKVKVIINVKTGITIRVNGQKIELKDLEHLNGKMPNMRVSGVITKEMVKGPMNLRQVSMWVLGKWIRNKVMDL